MTPRSLPGTLTVLVVDDHPLVRQGLRAILQTAVDELTFREAGTAAEAMEQWKVEEPDVAIVDLGLPDRSGLELLREMRKVSDRIPILVLSMQPEDVYAERVLRAGASGYVRKEVGGGAVLDALETVLRNEVYLSGEVALQIAATATGARRPVESPTGVLTDREFEIWKLLGDGLTTRRIARRLEISPKTVETHCYNIRKKSDLANSTELVHAATRWVHGRDGSR